MAGDLFRRLPGCDQPLDFNLAHRTGRKTGSLPPFNLPEILNVGCVWRGVLKLT
jgi:hypothetical protein